VLVLGGKLLGHSERPAAWNDGHFVDGVRARQQLGDQGVTGLMVAVIASFA